MATTEVGHLADRAMGIELRANEVESQIEWAEAQGRRDDVADLTVRLRTVLNELADLVDALPSAA